MNKIEWAKLITRTVIAIIKTDKIPTNKKFKAIIGVPSAVKKLNDIFKQVKNEGDVHLGAMVKENDSEI